MLENTCFHYQMIINKAYNFFLDHVWNEKLAGKLFHQCALGIDEVFRPNFHSKRDQEKK
jgi:hypothetical protein